MHAPLTMTRSPGKFDAETPDDENERSEAAFGLWARLACFFCVSMLLGASASAQSFERDRSRRRTPVVVAVEQTLPTVVDIQTKRLAAKRRRHPLDAFFDYGERRSSRRSRGEKTLRNHSLGSGVIIDPKGYVVTNDHVVRQADKIEIRLHDGRKLDAKLIGRDTDNDLAILKIQGAGPFPTVPMAASDDVMLGETVIAMGNPFGLEGSVTTGIISARNRSVEFRGKKLFEDFLQTSAVINPGNSGGPLLNINGELLGINVAIHSRGPGIGFAIPVRRVREVVYRLLDPRVARELWLGFDVEHRRESRRIRVDEVDSAGPAARAGLKVGDAISHLNGQALRNWIDLQSRIDESGLGAPMSMRVRRNGRELVLAMKVEAAPPSQSERTAFAVVGFEFRSPNTEEASRSGLEGGVVVAKVSPGSAANKIGLQAGDHIYQLGGYQIRDRKQAIAAISRVLRSRRRGLRISLYREASQEHLSGTILVDRRAALK